MASLRNTNNILILFVIIFIYFTIQSEVKANISTIGLKPYCNFTFNDAKSLNNLDINLLKIELDNHKKWIKNGLNIIKLKKYSIPLTFKKNFTANLNIQYKKDLECNFKIKIRQHGDWKDHINFEKGKIIQSVDINLIEGNILGITKFKLFLPQTRNSENEIIFTNILREIHYLAPRTFLIKVNINGTTTQMLFQEKITKEFLEFNNKKEGPILEGDEKPLWAKNINDPDQDNNKLRLSRLENSNWIKGNKEFLQISINALTKLNMIYFRYLSNIVNYYDPMKILSLDNVLLSNGNSEHKDYLDSFDILMMAADGYHGLLEHNRKFYYDPINNLFFPIYYDGNINFNVEQYYGSLSAINVNSIEKTLYKLNNINLINLEKNILQSGLVTNRFKLQNHILSFVNKIKKLSKKKYLNNEKLINDNFYDYLIKNDFNNVLIAYSENKTDSYNICDLKMILCNKIKLDINSITKLIAQRLIFNNIPVVYLGEIVHRNVDEIYFQNNFTESNKGLFNELIINKTKVYYNDDILINFNNETLNIFQKKLNGRVLIQGGNLDKIKVRYTGLQDYSSMNVFGVNNHKEYISGCLTFMDIDVNNLEIYFKNSNCEDAVNFLRVKGSVDLIDIENSLGDGLDIDFSEISIDKIYINNSSNDCIDLSSGKYSIKVAIVKNCGDKGLSIGENSNGNVEELSIFSSKSGVASKDSSIININNLLVKDSYYCMQAYRKKQEYFGGSIFVQNIECDDSTILSDNGSQIIIANSNDF